MSPLPSPSRHYLVVGGGIVGLATAYRLLETVPDSRVTLLEKDAALGQQQTSHNSGVLHSGLYYKPGSRKARMSVRGLRQMVAFCQQHGVRHEQCGKIVVATSPEELPRLDNLWERGQANGLLGLRRLNPGQIRDIEPHARGLAAIHVPQEGIVDYPGVVAALAQQITKRGGRLVLNARVTQMRRSNTGEWLVKTASAGEFSGDYLITCGGLHSDCLVSASGMKPGARIIPFRGEYYKIKASRHDLVRHLIYPVPDPQFPFLGVHFTRMIDGGIEAGPNALLAFSREGYSWKQISPIDLAGFLTYPGLWKFLLKYPSMSGYEVYRSLNRAEFCRSLQKLVPDIREDDLEPGGAGVRAQAMYPQGTLVEDFHFEQAEGILHVLNAPSPAATASLAIGEEIVAQVLGHPLPTST